MKSQQICSLKGFSHKLAENLKIQYLVNYTCSDREPQNSNSNIQTMNHLKMNLFTSLYCP